jgi:hypothetical protein
VNPIVQKLYEVLQASSSVSDFVFRLLSSTNLNPFAQLSDEARASTILQLEILSGIAKGLTRSDDGFTVLEEDSEVIADTTAVTVARDDPRAVKLRENIFAAIRGVVELWSLDVEISHVSSFLPPPITRSCDSRRPFSIVD